MIMNFKRFIKNSTLVLFATLLLGLTSCNRKNEVNNTVQPEPVQSTQPEVKMERHEVELNINNYQTYINRRSLSDGSYASIYFEGALSYAYYDNVVITYTRTNGSNKTTDTLKLSAGGYSSWYTTGYGTYTVTDVSGKVIYWI